MSNEQPAPLWSDEQINEEVQTLALGYKARYVLRRMRNDYEAVLSMACQSSPSEEATIARLTQANAELTAEIEHLKAPPISTIYDVIQSALTEYEYNRRAYFDGDPQALADADEARQALAWIREQRDEQSTPLRDNWTNESQSLRKDFIAGIDTADYDSNDIDPSDLPRWQEWHDWLEKTRVVDAPAHEDPLPVDVAIAIAGLIGFACHPRHIGRESLAMAYTAAKWLDRQHVPNVDNY